MSRIALLQMCSGIDPVENGASITDAIAQAAAGGAQMLFTPEMSGLVDRDRNRAASVIKNQADDPVLAEVATAAAQHRIWVSIGSLALRSNSSSQPFVNRQIIIDDQGRICTTYDKIHLFDVDLPSGESWRESAAYAPGSRAVLVETPLGKIGLSICYDIRFPSLYASLSEGGAEIFTVPAAFTVPTGKAHWHILLRARAIENGCWVVAAAQCGRHADGRETFGHSLVISPWGDVVLDMGKELGLGFADIDMTAVVDSRKRIPVIFHRRYIPKAEFSK